MKLIVDVTVTIVRAFEIPRLTGASVGFGKILLSATYNLFIVSIYYSMFNPTTKDISMTTLSTDNQDAPEHSYPVINGLPPSNRLEQYSYLLFVFYFRKRWQSTPLSRHIWNFSFRKTP